jgi:hypothetical protein
VSLGKLWSPIYAGSWIRTSENCPLLRTRTNKHGRRTKRLGYSGPDDQRGFFSIASVVVIVACVALLAVVSALALAPLDRLGRRYVVAFVCCPVAIWALAVLAIALIRRTI